MNSKVIKRFIINVLKFLVFLISVIAPIRFYGVLSFYLASKNISAIILIMLYVFYYVFYVLTVSKIFSNFAIIKRDTTSYTCGISLSVKKEKLLSQYTTYTIVYFIFYVLFYVFSIIGFVGKWTTLDKIVLVAFLVTLLIIVFNLLLTVSFIEDLIKDYKDIDKKYDVLNEKIKYLIKNIKCGSFEEFKIENVSKLSMETIRLNIIRRTLLCIYTAGSFSDEIKAMNCKYVYTQVISYIASSSCRQYEFIPDFDKALGKI